MVDQITSNNDQFTFLVGCWRQPIPTNMEVVFGEDYRCQLLYEQLILRACNKETATIRFENVLVTLSRGQVIYGRNKYSQYLQWSASTVDRTLLSLNEKYKLVDILRTRNYSIVTLQNYDELIKMNNQWTDKEPPMSTSKNIKIVKNINNRIVPNLESYSVSYKNTEGLEKLRHMRDSILGGKLGLKSTHRS